MQGGVRDRLFDNEGVGEPLLGTEGEFIRLVPLQEIIGPESVLNGATDGERMQAEPRGWTGEIWIPSSNGKQAGFFLMVQNYRQNTYNFCAIQKFWHEDIALFG
jgi:hypothetical protein